MRHYNVDGQDIAVEFRVIGRHLWLTGGFIVRIGDDVFTPDDRLEFKKTATKFQLCSGDNTKYGVVQSTKLPLLIPRVPYEVIFDGQTIATDTQRIKGLGLTAIIMFLIGSTLGLVFGLVFTIVLTLVRLLLS